MSPVNSLWFKWKSLRLPWRKSFLVGTDLSGNTFWEFKDALNAARYRRIVKFNPKTHYADVQVSPQWHQWLRYVRAEPPSVQEQQQDVLRQIQIKQLARLADERWASKPSYLDMPQTKQPAPATQTTDATMNASTQGSNTSPPPQQKEVENVERPLLKRTPGLQLEELLARGGSRSPGHRNRLKDEVEGRDRN
ncbi:hypothetical protein ABOM_004425 [Aspergillus bombycis]|uniref:Uncharacterized protein n=1 Tax=Aspergillus bombycis TaxID=109264 RepID=A0A1F8A684_9EURO|nr:hypothetical protein ABOM_004425 [Aspergillus bombycis]OGM46899.1 hypothetical protein ABOM_004425 [Aspergillus bombycis]